MVGFFASGLSDLGKEKTVKSKGSFLHLKLSGDIPDKPQKDPLRKWISAYYNSPVVSLPEIIHALKEAAQDEDIAGVFLENPRTDAGLATLEELRQALQEFKKSSKPVMAYADYLDQRNYFLASVADSLFLNPAGRIGHVGLAAQFISFKNLLDKLEIKAQIIRPDSNAFKSAVEPFMYEKMSRANRLQVRQLISKFWDYIVTAVAHNRKKEADEVRQWARELSGRNAIAALEARMVDGLKYYDDMLETLKTFSSTNSEKPNLIPLNGYLANSREKNSTQEKIVVIYAEGEITDDGSASEQIVGSHFAGLLRTARKDDKVKGVILRVNSPGGSALASEIIHREVQLTKAVKPVYVSMGNYAASGGYYISCAADSIFADFTTLTGSIGVFGVFPDMSAFFKNKIGIVRDTVLTERFSDITTGGRTLSAAEMQIFKEEIQAIYQRFLKNVAQGRRKSLQEIHAMAQGRIWSGADALRLGLVDRITPLEGALESMKLKLQKKDIIVEEWPKEKSLLNKIFLENFESRFLGQLFLNNKPNILRVINSIDYKLFMNYKVWAISPIIQWI